MHVLYILLIPDCLGEGMPIKWVLDDWSKKTDTTSGHLFIAIQFKFQTYIMSFWSPYVVRFKYRDSSYAVHIKHRDAPYVVHFIWRDHVRLNTSNLKPSITLTYFIVTIILLFTTINNIYTKQPIYVISLCILILVSLFVDIIIPLFNI